MFTELEKLLKDMNSKLEFMADGIGRLVDHICAEKDEPVLVTEITAPAEKEPELVVDEPKKELEQAEPTATAEKEPELAVDEPKNIDPFSPFVTEPTIDHKEPVGPISKPEAPESTKTPKQIDNLVKPDRDTVKRELENLGIEFNAKARTNTLEKLLETEKEKVAEKVEETVAHNALEVPVAKIEIPETPATVKKDDVREMSNQYIEAYRTILGDGQSYAAGVQALRAIYSEFGAINPTGLKGDDLKKCYNRLIEETKKLNGGV